MTVNDYVFAGWVGFVLLASSYWWGYYEGRETRPERRRRTLEGRERALADELAQVRAQRKQLG